MAGEAYKNGWHLTVTLPAVDSRCSLYKGSKTTRLMITVRSEYELEPIEITHLRSLLGKQFLRIESTSLSVWHPFPGYQFGQKMKIITKDCIVDLNASFTETHFGDDFHKLHIGVSSVPPLPIAPSTTISSCLWLGDNFIVSAIQVLGPRYESVAANDKTPVWSIEKQHPGIPIREIVDLSYVLLFHATNAQRMLIRPVTAASFIAVYLDDASMDGVLNGVANSGEVYLKEKLLLQ